MESSKKLRAEFLERLKRSKCLACGVVGVDMAHIPRWMPKLQRLGKASHVGNAWFFAIPLCRRCHLDQHKHKALDWLDEHVGLDRAYGWVANTLSDLLGIEILCDGACAKEIWEALETVDMFTSES